MTSGPERYRDAMSPRSDALSPQSDALSLRSYGICGLVLLVSLVLVFGDVMFAGDAKLLSKDTEDVAHLELGRRMFDFGQLAQGNFSLWCPKLFCGYPSFGGMQTGLVYPLSFLFLILSAVQAMNWSFILHTFLGGMFMYAWLARQWLHRLACIAGALMFAFGAPFFLRIYAGNITLNNTIAWIPLVFLAIDGLIATPSLGWLLLGTGAISMEFLAGFPQVFFYTAIAAALYTLLRIHRSPEIWKSLGMLVLMNVFAAGPTCVQWAAAIAATNECVRSRGVPFEFAASFSFPPENWLTLIRPGLFGDLQTVPYWGREYYWEVCAFFGTIGLFFAAVGLFHRERRRVVSTAALAVTMGVLAAGSFSPHFRFFYDHVPGFNLFRTNARFDILAVIFLIVLSAHGLDLLLRADDKKLLGRVFCGGLAACVATGAMYVAVRCCSIEHFKAIVDSILKTGKSTLPDPRGFSNSPDSIAAAAHFTMRELTTVLIFVAILTIALGLNWWRPRLRRLVAPIIVALIAVELIMFARKMEVSFSPAALRAPFQRGLLLSQTAAGQLESKPIPDLEAFLQKRLGDGRVFNPGNLNYALLMPAVREVWGYGPASMVERFAEFIAASQGGNPDDVTGYQSFTKTPRRFDMLRCQFVLLTQLNGSIDVLPMAKLAALPRFLIVGDWTIDATRDAVFRSVFNDNFDPREMVVLERKPADWPDESPLPWDRAKGTIRILGDSTDWQEVEVTVDKPAILLETDLYTPNWRVRALPGSTEQQYELIPANYILRAVPLKPGTHRLRIEYRPTGFIIGRWISLASLLSFLGLAVFSCAQIRKTNSVHKPLTTSQPAP